MTEQPNGDRPQPALRYERWPLAELQLDPDNARAHDRRNIEAIKGSLERFGQRLPVVVRHGQLVGGNGTTIAADELGLSHLDVVVSDDLTEPEARALAIALNRTAELAEWDFHALAGQLSGLQDLPDVDLAALGWTPHELEPLFSADWTPPTPAGSMDDFQRHDADRHMVSFTGTEWEAMRQATDRLRELVGEPDLTDAQALVVICGRWAEHDGSQP